MIVQFPKESFLLNCLEQGEQAQAQPLVGTDADKFEELLTAAKIVEKAWQFAIITGNAPQSNILDRLSAAIRECEPKEGV